MQIKTSFFTKLLEDFFPSNDLARGGLILREVSDWYDYSGGKRGDQIGYTYSVIDPENFNQTDVRVRSSIPPVISQDQLSRTTERIRVYVTNGKLIPSKLEFGRLTCRCEADSVDIVED